MFGYFRWRSDWWLVLLQSHTYNNLLRCVTFTQLTILHATIPILTSSHTLQNLTANFWMSPHSLRNFVNSTVKVKVKVKVTLRLTIGQSVSKSWCRAPSGAHDQIFITVWQLRSCFLWGALSDKRTVSSPYCCEGMFTLSLLRNGHGTQKTSYVTVTPLAAWRADCCLATRNNIWNSTVAFVYSVARCLSVCCLAIHVTIWSHITYVIKYLRNQYNITGLSVQYCSTLKTLKRGGRRRKPEEIYHRIIQWLKRTLSSGFLPKTVNAFLFPQCILLLDLIIFKFGKIHKLQIPSLHNFLHPPITSFLSDWNIPLSTLLLNSQWSSLTKRDTFIKRADKIIVFKKICPSLGPL
jgi:hypothetical protein